MSIEQRRCFLRALADIGCREFLSRYPNYFCNRRRHKRLDPVEALDNSLTAPAIEQSLSVLRGCDISKCSANLIGIENAGRIAVRIEKDEGAWLIEIHILGQPIKRPSVIVLDVNRQDLPRGRGAGGDQQRRCAKRRRSAVHRAP